MIKHVLADGKQVADIKDHVVLINDRTVKAYEIIFKKLIAS